MSILTIGSVTSRIKGNLKADHQDSFITDRFIYGIISKHAKLAMKRLDEKMRLMAFNSIFQVLPFVELIEVDKIEANSLGLEAKSTFMRTALSLPSISEGMMSPLIRTISSIDGSEEFMPIQPATYLHVSKSKNFKYNKTKYYWFLNDHIYFPNITWPRVRVVAVFEEDISDLLNEDDLKCIPRQEQSFNVPDYILSEIEANALKELSFLFQIPSDPTNDKQNPAR